MGDHKDNVTVKEDGEKFVVLEIGCGSGRLEVQRQKCYFPRTNIMTKQLYIVEIINNDFNNSRLTFPGFNLGYVPPGSVYIGADPHEDEREKLELNFVENDNVKLDRYTVGVSDLLEI